MSYGRDLIHALNVVNNPGVAYNARFHKFIYWFRCPIDFNYFHARSLAVSKNNYPVKLYVPIKVLYNCNCMCVKFVPIYHLHLSFDELCKYVVGKIEKKLNRSILSAQDIGFIHLHEIPMVRTITYGKNIVIRYEYSKTVTLIENINKSAFRNIEQSFYSCCYYYAEPKRYMLQNSILTIYYSAGSKKYAHTTAKLLIPYNVNIQNYLDYCINESVRLNRTVNLFSS